MKLPSYSLDKAKIVDNVILDGDDEVKPAIQGMSLYRCTIITSIVKDCKLSDCTLLSCTISSSKLDNCAVRQDIQPSLYRPFHPHHLIASHDAPPTHIRQPSILRNCEAKSCIITNSIISRGSSVQGGRLASCDVKHSSIRKAAVCETSILECKVENCNLYLSKYHDCKILRTSKTACKALSTLRILPPEIRFAILKLAMDLDGLIPTHMPAVIAALRPDQTLYHEALDLLRRDSSFSIDMFNALTVSGPRVEYIRILVLLYEFSLSKLLCGTYNNL
jgi:hypothetical protein